MTHDITTGAEKNHVKKRKGRGESSGHGKTSGRGNKGSKARNGKYIKPGYEGGQTAIFRRLPKRGFSNQNFERRFHIVNLGDLEQFDAGSTVDQGVLFEAGLVPDDKLPVKILSEGELTKKMTIVAKKFSKSAFEKLSTLGATTLNLKGEAFAFPKPKKKFVKREKVKKADESAAPGVPAAGVPGTGVPGAGA